jgi:hypothetical protein
MAAMNMVSAGGFSGVSFHFKKMSAGGRLCTFQENPHFLVPTLKVRLPDGKVTCARADMPYRHIRYTGSQDIACRRGSQRRFEGIQSNLYLRTQLVKNGCTYCKKYLNQGMDSHRLTREVV